MRSELLGLRTAGSAWSGSHPAVCESANHGRHGGHGPSATGTAGSVWTGRNVAARCDLAGMAWPVLFGIGWHGRRGSARIGQPSHGPHGRHGFESFGYRRVATHGRQCSVGKDQRIRMARQARHVTASPVGHGRAGVAWFQPAAPGTARQEWHSTAGPAIAGYAAHWLGLVWLGRQLTATLPTVRRFTAGSARMEVHGSARQAPHATAARHITAGNAWPEFQGLAWLFKSRQVWRC
jgi:hypothetical protein